MSSGEEAASHVRGAGSGAGGSGGARSHALAVLRVRSAALTVALLPAAVAAVLLIGTATGRLTGGWAAARWPVLGVALVVGGLALAVGLAIARTEPARSPTVPVPERAAPDLYRLIRDLSDRLAVPAPSAIALTPDCDSWLEDRTHGAGSEQGGESGESDVTSRPSGSRSSGPDGERIAPVLVIGSPFLWWMRVAELRAVLAPVVAGTGPAAHPDVAAARRFIRGLDAAVALDRSGPLALRPLRDLARSVARVLLRMCGEHPAWLERGVAAAASERAQDVDYGLRIAAQEQVGLAYAGWDRLLTRVALPAWRMGRWPSRLDAGVVSALTELSRRDRLAAQNGVFASRLGERPACDLLEEPGLVDEAASLLAAQLFHGGPAEPGPDWAPVTWDQYPDEVVDRKWRTEAARLHSVLDGLEVEQEPAGRPDRGTLARVVDWLAKGGDSEELAARLTDALDLQEAAQRRAQQIRPAALAPLFPLHAPRTDREVLIDHVLAMVCCAAIDTAGATPGLDWLDGPALLVNGERRPELGRAVTALAETGDPEPLRGWLLDAGVRPEKPVLLV
ncbi:hypothetical protein G5C51_19370 [Streptomyces sp. A7024]|uniref:Uncharacterized protein n=1 Tax=Streptomyces coryli TaxID=1128680 RepID=A0A6G4U1D5_9ACTN|nr:hypothetical protein [Streptomyces coryli]NGN66045.1 hypothetical protein [Streptomyces coryli]